MSIWYICSNSPVGKGALLPLAILAPTSAAISGCCDGFWLKCCSSTPPNYLCTFTKVCSIARQRTSVPADQWNPRIWHVSRLVSPTISRILRVVANNPFTSTAAWPLSTNAPNQRWRSISRTPVQQKMPFGLLEEKSRSIFDRYFPSNPRAHHHASDHHHHHHQHHYHPSSISHHSWFISHDSSFIIHHSALIVHRLSVVIVVIIIINPITNNIIITIMIAIHVQAMILHLQVPSCQSTLCQPSSPPIKQSKHHVP